MEGNSSQRKGGASKSNSGDEDSCFECNICLDSARDPVVTRCGHLYCWSCIYTWLCIQGNSQTCPVCKSLLTLSQLIPLLGCGTSTSDSAARTHHMGVAIPPRPPPNNSNIRMTGSSRNASASPAIPQIWLPIASFPLPNTPRRRPIAAITMSDVMMANPSFYRNSNPSHMYAYSHGLHYGSGGIPSFGRVQERENYYFLNMVSIILFCLVILCLIIF